MITLLTGLLWACSSRTPEIMDRDELLKTGDMLFHQYTCNTCHSLEGKEIYGPPLDGIYMKEVEVSRKGNKVKLVADRDYLKRSIADPEYEEVSGFESKAMPEVHISDKEVDLLVEYLVLIKKKGTNP